MTLEQAQDRIVQQRPWGDGSADSLGVHSLVLSMASVADDIVPWGNNPKIRDQQLRNFWPTEPVFSSALYNITGRNAAFSWTLEGPPTTVSTVQQIFHEADFGEGWLSFINKVGIDLFTQDNGAFIEIIRATDSPLSPVIGIAHLDAGSCLRTADPETPLIFTDRRGVMHRMKWYQVIRWAEWPSPIQQMNGVGYAALTRCLRAAQVLRDISVYHREKVGGDTANAIHLVSGMSTQLITDAMADHKNQQAQRGMTRYIAPLVLASVDPTATVSHAQIDLKSLPDGFDPEVAMRWYINQLAMAFGADYQDFAPLPGRALGSGSQSLILHMKSRGKGPALFMKAMEHKFNFHGVMPRNVVFRYDEQDLEEDKEQADLSFTRAQTRQIYLTAGALSVRAVQQQMLDQGEISQEEFDALRTEDEGGVDVTTDVVAHDEEPVEDKARHSRSKCMDCSKPPTIQVLWAEGRANAWFCDNCFKAWEKEHPGDVDKRKKIDGIATRRFYDKSLKQDEGPSTNRPNFMEEERLETEEAIEKDLAQVFSRHLDKIRARILPNKALKLIGRKQEDPRFALEDEQLWAELRADTMGAMQPHIRNGALAAAEGSAALGLVVDLDLVNTAVLDFTREYMDDWWNGLEAVSRNNLRKALTTWQESGLGERGLPDLVDSLRPTFGKARAKRIAVTEVTRVFDLGNNLAHIAAGITEEEWQTAEDDNVDDVLCKPLNGERFGVSEGPRPPIHVG